MGSDEIAVFCGLDVGKSEHHATALDPAGKRLHDKKLPNTEPRLRELFTSLAQHGAVLVVVDQPASIGAPHWGHWNGRRLASHRLTA